MIHFVITIESNAALTFEKKMKGKNIRVNQIGVRMCNIYYVGLIASGL